MFKSISLLSSSYKNLSSSRTLCIVKILPSCHIYYTLHEPLIAKVILFRMCLSLSGIVTSIWDSLLSLIIERTTSRDEDSTLYTISLVSPLVLLFLWKIYHHQDHVFASLHQLVVQIIKAILLLLAVFTISSIWLLYSLSLLFRTTCDRPTKLFANLRRFVTQVLIATAIESTIIISGSIWLLWCFMNRVFDTVGMFELPIACFLALGGWSDYSLFLKLPFFMVCVYLLDLGTKVPMEEHPVDKISYRADDRGVFLFSRRLNAWLRHEADDL